MATPSGRLLGRSLKDITTVRASDLKTAHPARNIVPIFTREENFEPAKAQVICVASGKGGTGKTVVTTNLAVALSKLGLKTVLFDADMGLANAHLLLGVSPEHDLSSVISGRSKMSDIATDCEANLKLIAGGSGFSDLADLKEFQLKNLAAGIKSFEHEADMILIDMAAGIAPQVMRFLNSAHTVLLVTTPDVTAMLDAYATVKSLAISGIHSSVKIIVNRARDRGEAMMVFKKVKEVAGKHLEKMDVSFFGWLPQNWYIQDSVSKRHPVVLLHQKSYVTECLKNMAKKIKTEHFEWQKRNESGLADDSFVPATAFSFKLGQQIF